MSSANFDSSDPSVPAVEARYSGPAGGSAVFATAEQSSASPATRVTRHIGSIGDKIAIGGIHIPNPPIGVRSYSDGGVAIFGQSNTGNGVVGQSDTGDGVIGQSDTGNAVSGSSVSGVAVYAFGPRAGVFVGNVEVTGDVLLTGADCAEEFEIAGSVEIEPGTVMVLDQEGRLQPSQQAYDKRVAGVISGAGNYKPGLVLDKQQSAENRMPVALVGKVYCKVDAQYAPIEVGDLLTTSPTLGHAMKADDPLKAFGSVIGKALRPLEGHQGMIPILIALQ